MCTMRLRVDTAHSVAAAFSIRGSRGRARPGSLTSFVVPSIRCSQMVLILLALRVVRISLSNGLCVFERERERVHEFADGIFGFGALDQNAAAVLPVYGCPV